MKINTSSTSKRAIQIDEESVDCRMSTAKEFDDYQKAVSKEPLEVTKLMIDFLVSLGMPKDVLWRMEFGHLQELVSYLTIGDVAKGK